jgi:hypothetical protein
MLIKPLTIIQNQEHEKGAQEMSRMFLDTNYPIPIYILLVPG